MSVNHQPFRPFLLLLTVQRQYFNMADYREWKEANEAESKNGKKGNEGKAA